MAYEKPQKGNPHQLTVKQHVIPRLWLRGFADSGTERIEVANKRTGATSFKHPNDEPFYVTRVWDQKSESCAQSYETRFRDALNDFRQNGSETLLESHQRAISGMYALWLARSELVHNRAPDLALKGVAQPEQSDLLSKDQEEQLESKGYIFCRAGRSDGAGLVNPVIPGRMTSWPIVQHKIGNFLIATKDLIWVPIRASRDEFLCPDTPSKEIALLPATPQLCFTMQKSQHSPVDAAFSLVEEINTKLVSTATDYYFARSMGCAPIKKG